MRPKMIALIVITVALLTAVPSAAATLDGTVKLGGVFVDETGDRSTVQETYNIYDGFALSQIHLMGTLNPRNFFMLNLQDINLDSRKGDLTYRVPGVFKATGRYRQHRQVFSSDRAVNSKRKDWRLGAQYTPSKWLSVTGSVDRAMRDGDRLSFPPMTASWLGTTYDNTLTTAHVGADVRRGRYGGGLSYRGSSFQNELDAVTDRRGHVVSGRFYAPTPFYEKWTNLVRGAYGISEITNGGLDYTLANFQYTGIVQPVELFQFKYRFDANRIDNKATALQTDRFQNDFDATVSQPNWRVRGGYGYELNDDDRTLTNYHSWRAGASFRYETYVNAKVDYAGRVKKDQEKLTLLNDVEASRFAAKLDVRPLEGFSLGGSYAKREREFPDIGVEADGDVVSAFGRYSFAGWGEFSADYAYTDDKFVDLAGRFDTRSHVVTSRLDVDRITGVHLSGGVTYLDIGGDLSIEKSMFFAEGRWTPIPNYHIEVKYNVYNYDDYILLDRYYTANVVRVNLGYNLHL